MNRSAKWNGVCLGLLFVKEHQDSPTVCTSIHGHFLRKRSRTMIDLRSYSLCPPIPIRGNEVENKLIIPLSLTGRQSNGSAIGRERNSNFSRDLSTQTLSVVILMCSRRHLAVVAITNQQSFLHLSFACCIVRLDFPSTLHLCSWSSSRAIWWCFLVPSVPSIVDATLRAGPRLAVHWPFEWEKKDLLVLPINGGRHAPYTSEILHGEYNQHFDRNQKTFQRHARKRNQTISVHCQWWKMHP